jgi:hypothetical protein
MAVRTAQRAFPSLVAGLFFSQARAKVIIPPCFDFRSDTKGAPHESLPGFRPRGIFLSHVRLCFGLHALVFPQLPQKL